jgi:hypothetical protein
MLHAAQPLHVALHGCQCCHSGMLQGGLLFLLLGNSF